MGYYYEGFGKNKSVTQNLCRWLVGLQGVSNGSKLLKVTSVHLLESIIINRWLYFLLELQASKYLLKSKSVFIV